MSDATSSRDAPSAHQESEIGPELTALAFAYGVATSYIGQDHEVHHADASTVRKVLATLDVDASSDESIAMALDDAKLLPWRRVVPPVVVVRQGTDAAILVHVPAQTSVRLRIVAEEGADLGELVAAHPWTEGPLVDGVRVGVVTFAVPLDLPLGWHEVVADISGVAHTTTLVVTPVRLPTPERGWGLTTQLYSTRSLGSWGFGDLADLREMAIWSASHGADFVLINPIFSPAPSEPREPSPYMPITRRFFDPLYLRVEDLPEYAQASAEVRSKVDALGERAKAVASVAALVDRDAAWSAKSEALWEVFTSSMTEDDQRGLDDVIEGEGRDLQYFAIWCLCVEELGRDSGRWPEGLQWADPDAINDFAQRHVDRSRFHIWLQWRLAGQMEAAQRVAIDAGMSIGVIHDLPVGVDPSGFDVWIDRTLFAGGVTVGCPPDLFNQMGQDWSLPPWRPEALVDRAYRPFRDVLRAVLSRGGGVRIDHVLAMFRKWWIPTGCAPPDGVYVQYNHEAMLGIIALEAHRAGAVVIGEDMGTVQKSVAEALRERGLLGTSVMWFERRKGKLKPPEKWRPDVLACATVHDIPPTAGFIEGEHIRLRASLGLLTESIDSAFEAHRRLVERWLTIARERGLLDEGASIAEQVVALNAVVMQSPSVLRGVALVDVVGERRAQNQPGTYREYSNWQVPLGDRDGVPLYLEQVYSDERVARFFAAIGAIPN